VAHLAAVLATTHHPFYLKLTSAPPKEQIPQAPEWKRKVEAYRETLTAA
jgi:protocatechuate 4,5-dioxygenase beta chain